MRELWKLFFFPLLDIYWPKKSRSGSERKLFFFPLLDIYWPKKCRSGSERDMKTILFSPPIYCIYWPKNADPDLVGTLPGNCPPRSQRPFSAWAAAGADSSAAWAAWAAAAVSSPNSPAAEPWAAPPTPGLCRGVGGGPAPERGARTWGSSTSPEVGVPAIDFWFFKRKDGISG